ncbi:integrase/recombinase [Thauera sp. 28]|uniref:tyrosine-type recombinase/integrase n=1 Tax=unclassified Thauera TaxID=2609274 RepID=UPI0002CFEB5C|nr:tyrosine-type recombinase/integrase [Thauera sp. 28]ENO91603.1 integrase/recombinase [Thauera sp. 28]
MASIVKRGDYQYQVTIRRKGFPKQCKTFESEREAKDWAKVVESEMIRGVFTDRSELERTTLAELLERYGEEVTVEKLGARQEKGRIRHWMSHPLAKRSLASLRSKDFADYRNARLKVVSAHTVRLELALISAVFNHASKDWSMPLPNLIKGIRPPKTPSGRDRRLMGDEEDRLLAAAGEARAYPHMLVAAIELAVETGIREDRLATMRWNQVNLQKGVVKVMTKEELHEQELVSVPLSMRALQILESLPRDISGKVFGCAFPTGNVLGKAFERACKRAKIEDLRFHDLRHEAASRLAPHMPMVTLAKIMGWKTVQMAMRYYNPTDEELVKARRAAA